MKEPKPFWVCCSRRQQRLATPSEPSHQMLAAVNTKPRGPSNPSGEDKGLISTTMSCRLDSTTFIGEQIPLPLLEDQACAVVVVDSKQYVLGERLGRGAGGSVFAATLKREAADVHAAVDEESDGHDPDSMALKLVGGVRAQEFRGADTRLAAVAVEAVAAAE
eukprot:3595152-Amphidinium_carterae.1